jgi:hypothetical protein
VPYRTFDKQPQVNQAAIVENKRIGPILAYIAEKQKELACPDRPRHRAGGPEEPYVQGRMDDTLGRRVARSGSFMRRPLHPKNSPLPAERRLSWPGFGRAKPGMMGFGLLGPCQQAPGSPTSRRQISDIGPFWAVPRALLE